MRHYGNRVSSSDIALHYYSSKHGRCPRSLQQAITQIFVTDLRSRLRPVAQRLRKRREVAELGHADKVVAGLARTAPPFMVL